MASTAQKLSVRREDPGTDWRTCHAFAMQVVKSYRLAQSDSLMSPENPLPRGSDRSVRRHCPANPLWTLEELHDLRNPPFVADTEFARFDLDAFVHDDSRRASLLSTKATRYHVSEWGKRFKATFPVPPLVAGLPWRFVKDTRRPVLPDPLFAPFDLRYIDRRLTR
jgi:hypothetical protein